MVCDYQLEPKVCDVNAQASQCAQLTQAFMCHQCSLQVLAMKHALMRSLCAMEHTVPRKSAEVCEKVCQKGGPTWKRREGQQCLWNVWRT